MIRDTLSTVPVEVRKEALMSGDDSVEKVGNSRRLVCQIHILDQWYCETAFGMKRDLNARHLKRT